MSEVYLISVQKLEASEVEKAREPNERRFWLDSKAMGLPDEHYESFCGNQVVQMIKELSKQNEGVDERGETSVS